MKFSYEGSIYWIEFMRKPRERKVGGLTTYPATTVRIFKASSDGLSMELFREATAGYSYTNETRQFTLEGGRLAALRLVSGSLPKGCKRALWDAYMTRKG